LQALSDPDAIRTNLQQACLAIHFLGGADPAGLDAIYTSINVCSGQTILYQPFGEVLEPHEELWLGEFENAIPAAPGSYQRLAGKNDQELLALVDEQITQIPPDSGADIVAKADLTLVCEKADLEDVQRLKEMIETKRAVEVDFPDFLWGRPTPTESLRKWQDYLKRGGALLFYYGASERNRLEAKWRQAEKDSPKIRRNWYLAPPDLDLKRQLHPNALWELQQIVCFIEECGSA